MIILLLTDGQHVEDGSYHGHEEDCAQVVEEQPVGHEVARVQDDRGQHEEEEGVRGEGGGHLVRRDDQQEPDYYADHDQQAGLGEDRGKLGGHVEACNAKRKSSEILLI